MPGRSACSAHIRGSARAAVLGAFLLVTAFAVPTGAQDTSEEWARFPLIQEGDYWDYELSGRDRGSMMNEVRAQEEKTNHHFGSTTEAFLIESTGVVYSDQVSPLTAGGLKQGGLQGLTETEHEIDAKKWIRVDDHATHQLEGQVIIEGSIDAEVIEVFGSPFVQSFFPYTQGFTWVSVADFYLKRGGDDPKEGEAVLRARVTDMETIEVPAGEFMTWRLEMDVEYEGDRVTANVIQWFSQDACGLVKEERYDSGGNLVNRMELSGFSCSGEWVAEPDYSGRGVELTATGNQQPPWLEEDLPVQEEPIQGADGGLPASALPSGPVLWIAIGVMAGASVLLFLLGRRRS